jgi:hypothetical protein
MRSRTLGLWLGFVLAVTAHASSASATTFELSPLESNLSLSGYAPADQYYPERPFVAPGTSLSGTLEVSQWSADSLRIDDSWIIPKVHGNGKIPTVFAVEVTGEGILVVDQSYAPLWGVLTATGTPGTYQVDETQLGFGTRNLYGQPQGDSRWYTDSFGRVLDNIAVGNASLTQADGRYRLEIPFASTDQLAMKGEGYIRFTGQLVAYSDIAPKSGPSIADGRFELGESWTAGDDSGGVIFNPSVTKYTWSLDQQEWGHASLRPDDSTEYFYQQIAGEGMLSSDTLYEVMFDLANLTDHNGTSPDDATSVEVYLSLGGVERTGEYDAAGGLFRLEHLSQLALNNWQHDVSFFFDTSLLTPEQLQQNVFLVFRATSKGGKSAVDFDNVRLSVVPEPSTLALGVLAATASLIPVWNHRPGNHRGTAKFDSAKHRL